MRVVVGTGRLRDLRQAELDRHIEMMSRYIGCAQTASEREALTLTMIVRSAESAPAEALVRLKHELGCAGISAKVVLAKLDREQDVKKLFAALQHLAPQQPAKALIRWARNPRLLDAHEQVTYGTAMCWSGDAMRRDADKRNALTVFDEAAPDTVRLGRLAFEALWAASSLVPERRLSGRALAKPSGAYQPTSEAPVAALRPRLQGWPLIRH